VVRRQSWQSQRWLENGGEDGLLGDSLEEKVVGGSAYLAGRFKRKKMKIRHSDCIVKSRARLS
jgi:hypothetical protein